MSRSRTRERRQERERQRKRQQQIALVGGVAVVAVLLVVFILLANQPADATIPEETVAKYAGVPTSETDAGFPVLGNPNAPVQVIEYSSFDCPACGRFYSDSVDVLIDRAAAGEIAFTYVPLHGTGSIPNGQGAARAALCAGEQGAFWPYHSALFSWQEQYGNAAFAGNRLSAGVEALELDRGQWDACMSGNRPETILDAAINAARGVPDFAGTPTITVNGVNVQPSLVAVQSAIETGLQSAPPVIPPVVEEAEPEDESAEEETVEEAGDTGDDATDTEESDEADE